jgi:hypothetical protein
MVHTHFQRYILKFTLGIFFTLISAPRPRSKRSSFFFSLSISFYYYPPHLSCMLRVASISLSFGVGLRMRVCGVGLWCAGRAIFHFSSPARGWVLRRWCASLSLSLMGHSKMAREHPEIRSSTQHVHSRRWCVRPLSAAKMTDCHLCFALMVLPSLFFI